MSPSPSRKDLNFVCALQSQMTNKWYLIILI